MANPTDEGNPATNLDNTLIFMEPPPAHSNGAGGSIELVARSAYFLPVMNIDFFLAETNR